MGKQQPPLLFLLLLRPSRCMWLELRLALLLEPTASQLRTKVPGGVQRPKVEEINMERTRTRMGSSSYRAPTEAMQEARKPARR